VWIALSDGALLLDLAVVAEPLRLANRLLEADGRGVAYDVRFVAPKANVVSSCEVTLSRVQRLPRALLGSVQAPAWVFIVGTASDLPRQVSGAQQKAGQDVLVHWLRTTVKPAIHADQVKLFTVCSGALMAGDAGLLDAKQCTTHHALTARLRETSPRAQVLENRIYVQDGAVATSAGVTAGLDLTLAAIGEHLGVAIASAVARDLVVYWRRSGSDPQDSPLLAHRNHMHAAVHRAQDAVFKNPAGPWSVESLAAHACVSSRHLRRLFADHAHIAPLAYVQTVRVALVRERVRARGQSTERAAQAVGFSGARQFRDAVRALAR
jgi:transcriptional regulator GlxA family with amidase domain